MEEKDPEDVATAYCGSCEQNLPSEFFTKYQIGVESSALRRCKTCTRKAHQDIIRTCQMEAFAGGDNVHEAAKVGDLFTISKALDDGLSLISKNVEVRFVSLQFGTCDTVASIPF